MRAAFLASAILALAATPSAFAKGGEETKSDCPRGQIADTKGKCVDADDKSASADALYEQGRYLARNGAYTDALNMLRYADQADAGVLTYTGFATRKLGDVRGGMRYYAKALSIDPRNTIARSYLGEAFLMQDMREKAAAELEAIAAIEGRISEPYLALAKAVSAYDDGTWDGRSY